MNALPTLRPITRALLRPCSICSQFIRLDGELGWLTLPENPIQDGYEMRKAFGVAILPYYDGLFDTAEQTTPEDLKAFYGHRKGISDELSAFYAKANVYSGD